MAAEAAFCSRCGAPRPPGAAFCQACGNAFATADSRAEPVAVRTLDIGAVLMIVGGALGAIGSLMPWITATTFGGAQTRSGVDSGGDGVLTLLVGVIASLAGLVRLAERGGRRVPGLLAGLVLVGLAAFDHMKISESIARDEILRDIAEVGVGLWVLGIGGLLTVVGALMTPRAEP